MTVSLHDISVSSADCHDFCDINADECLISLPFCDLHILVILIKISIDLFLVIFLNLCFTMIYGLHKIMYIAKRVLKFCVISLYMY